MKRKEFLKNLDSINKNLKLIKTGNKENKER
jgi:hypothetical protein